MEDHVQEYPSAFELLDRLKDVATLPEHCAMAIFVTFSADGESRVFSCEPEHLRKFALIISNEIKEALGRACTEQLRRTLQ